MRTKTALPPRAFRPLAENESRLAYAQKIGLNVTDLINEALLEALPKVLKRKAEELREALTLAP